MATTYEASEQKRISALIKKECCNYDNGKCMLLELMEKEPTPCVQEISTDLTCGWFQNSVLPNDPQLMARLTGDAEWKKCEICHRDFIPTGTNSKYCDRCRPDIRKQKKREYEQRRRLMKYATAIYAKADRG